MRFFSPTAMIIMILANTVSFAQDKQDKIEQAVIVPTEVVLLLSAYQPDCPLKIEHAELHAYLNGGSAPDLKLRNEGNIPIRSFKIAYVDSAGTGGSWTISKEAVLPGQTATVSKEHPSVKIIALSESLQEKLQLKEKAKGMIIFIVVRIEYTDGKVYDGKTLFEAAKKYFDRRN